MTGVIAYSPLLTLVKRWVFAVPFQTISTPEKKRKNKLHCIQIFYLSVNTRKYELVRA